MCVLPCLQVSSVSHMLRSPPPPPLALVLRPALVPVPVPVPVVCSWRCLLLLWCGAVVKENEGLLDGAKKERHRARINVKEKTPGLTHIIPPLLSYLTPPPPPPSPPLRPTPLPLTLPYYYLLPPQPPRKTGPKSRFLKTRPIPVWCVWFPVPNASLSYPGRRPCFVASASAPPSARRAAPRPRSVSRPVRAWSQQPARPSLDLDLNSTLDRDLA